MQLADVTESFKVRWNPGFPVFVSGFYSFEISPSNSTHLLARGAVLVHLMCAQGTDGQLEILMMVNRRQKIPEGLKDDLQLAYQVMG